MPPPLRLDRLNRLVRDGRTIDGRWRMTPRHELQYRRDGPGEELVAAGDLVSAEPLGLTFRLEKESREEDTRRRELQLKGRWQADSRNRLTFRVEREQGAVDILTLEGGWEVGPGNEIQYRFERTERKKGARALHRIRFEGYWEVGEDRRLAYVLEAGSNSAFRFRGAFQTDSIRRKEGALRYQIGVEAEKGRSFQTVTLFGKWKISRDLSLEFEVPYAGGFRRAMKFGATYSWDSRTSVSARLAAPGGGPLGVELSLHREFLQGRGEAFVRLRRSLEETAAEAGARVRW